MSYLTRKIKTAKIYSIRYADFPIREASVFSKNEIKPSPKPIQNSKKNILLHFIFVIICLKPQQKPCKFKKMLDTSIEYLKGVGAYRAETLKSKLGIYVFEHLLEYYPFRYVDKTQFHTVSQVNSEDESYQIRGVLRRIEEQGEGNKKRVIGTFRDETGVVELIWFKGLSWAKSLQVGAEYVIYGRPEIYNHFISFVHPEMDLATVSNNKGGAAMSPVYPSTKELEARGLDSKGMAKLVRTLFEKLHPQRHLVAETLTEELIKNLQFPSRYDAILGAHFPKTEEQLKAARRRLKFEELFFLQLRILQSKVMRKQGIAGFVFTKVGKHFNDFYSTGLKFELTGAQKRVLKEIHKDMSSGQQMNRLLQGDVGSGKTMVAFMSMLIAIDNGHQAALIAPTEILSQQHYQSIAEMAHVLGVRVALLTGSVRSRLRRSILAALADGDIDIIIGTHALFEKTVVFKSLGLAIIDEQHRFGVIQRSQMWAKTDSAPPHILVMTATPIPRTLAMTVYGDLDVSIIDEMPPGRIPITTYHKYESQRLWVFGLMKKEIDQGRQVYIVYPLIGESESETLADVKNLQEGVEAIEREFPRPQYQISIVHGKQKAEDKEQEMRRFVKGETQIMVATTVIEVGVNVPNATLMIIENAERFGLAQLHQLRGRVGRGGGESFCVLMTTFKLSEEGKFRMETMCGSTDGFVISEADLRLRGPGNIEGTQQSGMVNLRMADLVRDAHILQTARHLAEGILEEDPNLTFPKNAALLRALAKAQETHGFGRIS
jgi:ATP-dependent DNA helicase RecG